MPSWAVGFSLCGMYWISIFVVPTRKLCKGLFTRYVLKKVVPPKSAWNHPSAGHTYRYVLWLGATSIMAVIGVTAGFNSTWAVIFWCPIILVLLDDYIFGDDDSWKRFKAWSGNKIKWLMDLPPEPARQETA